MKHLITKIDIFCLSEVLSKYIEFDLSKINIGNNYHLSDTYLQIGIKYNNHIMGNNSL